MNNPKQLRLKFSSVGDIDLERVSENETIASFLKILKQVAKEKGYGTVDIHSEILRQGNQRGISVKKTTKSKLVALPEPIKSHDVITQELKMFGTSCFYGLGDAIIYATELLRQGKLSQFLSISIYLDDIVVWGMEDLQKFRLYLGANYDNDLILYLLEIRPAYICGPRRLTLVQG